MLLKGKWKRTLFRQAMSGKFADIVFLTFLWKEAFRECADNLLRTYITLPPRNKTTKYAVGSSDQYVWSKTLRWRGGAEGKQHRQKKVIDRWQNLLNSCSLCVGREQQGILLCTLNSTLTWIRCLIMKNCTPVRKKIWCYTQFRQHALIATKRSGG